MSTASQWVKIWHEHRAKASLLRSASGFVEISAITKGEFNRLRDSEGIVAILANKGFVHVVGGASVEDFTTLIASGRTLHPWTEYASSCYFTDETDAVAFKLMINP